MDRRRAGAARLAALLVLALAAMIGLPGAGVLAQTASGQPYVDPEHARSLLEDPADKARYKALAEELRCLVCQNQTLADSDASLAVDLRRQLETMVLEGRSDEQIKAYLVERYGDFVLYRPPVQGNTWLLWFGPFVLLAIGIAVWVLVRRGRPAAASEGIAPATATPAPVTQPPGSNARSSSRGPAVTTGPNADAAVRDADLERARRLLDGG